MDLLWLILVVRKTLKMMSRLIVVVSVCALLSGCGNLLFPRLIRKVVIGKVEIEDYNELIIEETHKES